MNPDDYIQGTFDPRNPANQKEQLTEEINEIDEVMERIENLKYILKSTGQPYFLSLVEQIEDKLITIFQI